MPKTCAERKRKQRALDLNDPERKYRKLDTMFMFGYVEVAVIIDLWGEPWFRGVDIARSLDMEDPHNSISKTIDSEYTKSYKNISSNRILYRDIHGMHPETTFVNETGMNMFIIRSRMPKAEEFARWVCGVVLPAIRKNNKYEINSQDNPYKELNDLLRQRNEELKYENMELKNNVKFKDIIIENKEKIVEESVKEISKLTTTIFSLRPTCVMENKNKIKDEYCIFYKKSVSEDTDDFESAHFPYYACRVQDDSIHTRFMELKTQYPYITQIRKYKTPNSVNFFNYILTELPMILERGNGKFAQSFRIKNAIIDENAFLKLVDNIYRVNYGYY